MKSTTKIIIGVVIGFIACSWNNCIPKRMDHSVKRHSSAVRSAAERNRGQCSAFQTSRPRRGD